MVNIVGQCFSTTYARPGASVIHTHTHTHTHITYTQAECQCNGSYFDVPTLKQMHVETRSGECALLQDQSRVVPEARVRAVEQAFSGLGGSRGSLAVVTSHDGKSSQKYSIC